MDTDASLRRIAILYGALAVYVMAVIAEVADADDRAAALGYFRFWVPAGIALFCWLFAGPSRPRTEPGAGGLGTCHVCGRQAPTADIRVVKVTGRVVLLALHQDVVRACRRCGLRASLRAMGYTAAFGWWGLFSFFITPGFILHDLAMALRVLVCTRARPQAEVVRREG